MKKQLLVVAVALVPLFALAAHADPEPATPARPDACISERRAVKEDLVICQNNLADALEALGQARRKMAHVEDILAPENIVRHLKSREQACKQSRACGRSGACGFDPEYEGCVATKTEHCARSQACKMLGLCGLGPVEGSNCAPMSDADCKRSRACKEGGRCFKVGDSCDS